MFKSFMENKFFRNCKLFNKFNVFVLINLFDYGYLISRIVFYEDYFNLETVKIFDFKSISRFIILLGMWYYFTDLELPEGNSSSIIISRPVEDNEAESLIANQIDAVNQDDELISEVTIINSESLDEVISNYEANTQN